MIDIHTHLFNLKYLPLMGIIREYSHNKIPPIIANAVANSLLRHTRSDDDSLERLSKSKLLNKETVYKLDKPLFTLTQTEVIDSIVNNFSSAEINNDEMQKALMEFHHMNGDIHKVNEIRAINRFSLESAGSINIENFISISAGIKDMFNWVFSKIKKGENFVRWVYLMQHSESDIYTILQLNVPGMKYYVHHMMDVDNYFNDHSTFDFETQQIPKMQKLNDKFKDKLIGFVAYDPLKSNCLDIVKDAIENRGFKGVKFYPPMGYKALGNDSALLDNKNKELFRYCIQKDLPLFSHCNNEGFQADINGNSGYNSNPKYWEMVLETEEFKNLRLCLAHAGGVEGWFCPVAPDDKIKVDDIKRSDVSDNKQENWNSSYAMLVYKLCVKYPNVYCDAAYLDEVLDVALIENFKERLVKLFKSQPKFVKKIMFGTDWHMLYQDGENDTFYTAYKQLFSSTELLHYNDAFFEGNALAYLKML